MSSDSHDFEPLGTHMNPLHCEFYRQSAKLGTSFSISGLLKILMYLVLCL